MKIYRVGPKVPPYKLHKSGLGPWGPPHFLKQNEYLQVVWVKTTQTIINHEFWGGYEMPTPKFCSPSKKCVTVVKEKARREKNINFE